MGNQCGACFAKNANYYEKPSAKALTEDRQANKIFEDNIKFLSNVPLFGRLHPSDVPVFVQALINREWAREDVVMREGDIGDEFFVIKSVL